MHWTGSERSPHSRRHNMMSSLYGLELVVDKGCPDERITAIPVVDIVFEIGKALKHVLYVRGGGTWLAVARVHPAGPIQFCVLLNSPGFLPVSHTVPKRTRCASRTSLLHKRSSFRLERAYSAASRRPCTRQTSLPRILPASALRTSSILHSISSILDDRMASRS